MSQDANPILVEITRGALVESLHRGAAAVVDHRGVLHAAWGDIARRVYARSALKPLQALPLIESGAADHFGLGAVEIALACASHSGEPGHVNAVKQWLSRIGLDAGALECGVHLPYHDHTAAHLLRSGGAPSALHNNCSGKHAGFLSSAVYLGENPRGYIHADHPRQQQVRRTLEEMSDTTLGDAPTGIDGCGIPVIGLSLRATAYAMARLAEPQHLPPARAQACRRIVAAMANQPWMVAGSGRFGTAVMDVIGNKAIIKIGAEGVFTAALPGLGLGIALKIDDGAARAAIAIGALIDHLGVLTEAQRRTLADILEPPVYNRAGLIVGRMRRRRSWLQ
ncbi:MAG: asparaginase [Gammaproteobacteria bacterium]